MNVEILIIIVTSVALLSVLFYNVYQSQRLYNWRDNLKPGDLVSVKAYYMIKGEDYFTMIDGVIVKRLSKYSYEIQYDTDSWDKAFKSFAHFGLDPDTDAYIKNIYKPSWFKNNKHYDF